MHRGEARPPPRVATEVVGGSSGGMTGVTVLNQKHATQVAVMRTKLLQRLDVIVESHDMGDKILGRASLTT